MKRLVDVTNLSKKRWLEERRKGVGASDAAAICGLSKKRGPIHVFLEKTDRAPEDFKSEAASWGHRFEQAIAEEFSERTGFPIKRETHMLQHSEHEWMLCNLDFWTQPDDLDGLWVPLEIKNLNAYVKPDWEDQCPDWVEIQVQHQIAITESPRGYVMACVGGQAGFPYLIDRNDDAIECIIRLEHSFWFDHVITDTPPPFEENDSDILKALYPQASDATIPLDDELEALCFQHEEWRQKIKAAEVERNKAANKLKGALKDAELAENDVFKVRWGNVTTNKFDSKAFKADHKELYDRYSVRARHRTFSVKEKKQKETKQREDL